MKTLLFWIILVLLGTRLDTLGQEPANEPPLVIVAVGAPGEKEFGESFDASARAWEKACQKADAQFVLIGLDPPGATNDLDCLKGVLANCPRETTRELWLVLIGHGTFDGREAKFNLRGLDLAATELAAWLEPLRGPLVVINSTSSSGPFLNKLSAPGRIIVTGTRSGHELNFTRFGEFFSKSLLDPKADLDKDGQVSVLETFLMAAHGVAEFYKTEGRLATEHPLLDDNGDGRGTPPDWFRGVRAIKKASEGASLDGSRAHQVHLVRSDAERKLSPAVRARRNELEIQLEDLRQLKETLATDDYYERLEPILLELARLYESTDATRSP